MGGRCFFFLFYGLCRLVTADRRLPAATRRAAGRRGLHAAFNPEPQARARGPRVGRGRRGNPR